MIVIGIDPGLSGAIAVTKGRDLLELVDLPTEDVIGSPKVKRRLSAPALAATLRHLRSTYSDGAELAIVERVSAMPGQGTASVFSLGDTCGVIRGVLGTLGIEHRFVTSGEWKKHFRLKADKDQARTRASEAFPSDAHLWQRKLDHNRAEAALLARFGWETMA